MNKKVVASILVVLFCIASIFAVESETVKQEAFVKSTLYPQTPASLSVQLGLGEIGLGEENQTKIENPQARAMGSLDYMVTPGDVYSLTYYTPSQTGASYMVITQNLVVDASYNIAVPYVGTVDAKGMTFLQFKQYSENQMKMFYSYLNPQFTILSCGSFQVYVYGEVNCTTNVSVWGFARLSDLSIYATDYASSREIEVTYSDGTVKTYDLLKACLLGDEANNPYIVPGSKVKFKTAEKTAWISGSVKKPGQYQLKENETIKDLITFARGFLFDSDINSISVSSYKNGSFSSVNVDYEKNSNYAIKNMDAVVVSGLTDHKALISIQGAVVEGKINYEFVEGETALQVLTLIKGSLLPTSDVEGIYVERSGSKLAVNSKNDVVLKEGDTIQVPYTKQMVTVSGAVSNPGSYEYEPGKNAEYYVYLAGGYTSDARQGTLRVLDSNGIKLKSNSTVLADYTVNVKRRNTNVSSDITLGISIVSIALTLVSAIISYSK